MYSLRHNISKSRLKRKSIRINGNNFSVGYLIIVVTFIIFIIRAINVLNSYNDPGGYAYVQMLNYSMPIVKTAVYDEGTYVESNLSIKDVFLEAIGINGINTLDIVANEISIFNDIADTSSIISNEEGVVPFSLNNDSVARMTDEEIEQLNKVSSAYDPSLKKTLDNSKPEVLILYTHTTENYSEVEALTTDNNFNVVGVGEVISKELEEGYGISVINDKTNHCVSYNEAYSRSNKTLQEYLNKYGDFKLIIDLHRDGVDLVKADKLKSVYTTNINDENLAKMMFVTGQNSSRYAQNKALVDELYNITNDLFPGLIRETYEYEIAATAINHSLSDNFVLLEVGANVNSAQEAKLTGKYIARVIAEYLNR